jgi:hypothetical protein
VLVALDGEFGTLCGEGFEADVEPVDAEVEPSLQLLSAAEVKSYKQMKEGTSENDTADAHWLTKMRARPAGTEAKACIDDIPVASKGGGGNPNAAVRAHIKTICSEAGACFKKTRFRLPLALRRGISTPTTTRNQRRWSSRGTTSRSSQALQLVL